MWLLSNTPFVVKFARVGAVGGYSKAHLLMTGYPGDAPHEALCGQSLVNVVLVRALDGYELEQSDTCQHCLRRVTTEFEAMRYVIETLSEVINGQEQTTSEGSRQVAESHTETEASSASS